jgi:hypothetical protein
MNVSERIEILLDEVNGLQIGHPPAEAGPNAPNFFIRAKQTIETSEKGNFVELEYQTIGESIVECLEHLAKQVETAGALKKKGSSPILTRGGERQ